MIAFIAMLVANEWLFTRLEFVPGDLNGTLIVVYGMKAILSLLPATARHG